MHIFSDKFQIFNNFGVSMYNIIYIFLNGKIIFSTYSDRLEIVIMIIVILIL